MKIWTSFGSEHSANLVLIGMFKDLTGAQDTKAAFDAFAKYAGPRFEELDGSQQYSDEVMALAQKHHVMSLAPYEIAQFAYDIQWKLEGEQLTVTTEEIDVSALIKIMINKGARIEIYSAHDYPDATPGR